MITRFRTLFTLGVSHTYYDDGASNDFRFFMPSDTARALKGGRILTKESDGVLRFLYEADEAGDPIASIAGTRLRIGLELTNPYFTNFTELEEGFADYYSLVYGTTSPSMGELDHQTVAGEAVRVSIGAVARPVTVRLKDRAGTTLEAETVTDPARQEVAFLMTGRKADLYQVQVATTGSSTWGVYYDPEMLSRGVRLVAEITIGASNYAAPVDFRVELAAKMETLKYYVVAKNYNQTDFDLLTVADSGYTDDGRSQVTFTPVVPDDFTAADISEEVLETLGDKIILFKSDVPVARRELGRTKIQLIKNGEVLIAHLPQPGIDKPDSNMIIHISKP